MTTTMTALTTLAAHPGPWQHGADYGPPAWWPVFPVGFGLFWLAVLAGAFMLLRRRGWGRTATAGATAGDPLAQARATLAERFARGEIDEDEYHARSAALRADL